MRHWRRWLIAFASGVLAVVLGLAPAVAQSRQNHLSFLTPFPDGDIYRTMVIGDWLAQGLHGGLSESITDEARIEFRNNSIDLRGFLRGEYESGMGAVRSELSRSKYAIAVVWSGAFDRLSIRGAGGVRHAVGSGEWSNVFGERVEALMKTLRQANVSVYWVGLPVMRGEHRNDDIQAINEIYRQRAYRHGIRYIDIVPVTGNEDGEFSPYGPDATGMVRLLRYKDGIHFTRAGYEKVAQFIGQQIRRDMAEAKSERDIPLLGSENDQKRIAPLRAGPKERPAGASGQSAGAETAAAGQAGEPADSTELTLNLRGQGGRNQPLKIELLRPAIAGSVIAVLTRGQSDERASKVGLTISDELSSGLMVLRSITPAAGGVDSGAKVPASELPFFRVLVKGERLPSIPGRADDFTWPRNDAVPPPAQPPPKVAIRRPLPNWDPSLPPLPPRRPIARRNEQGFSPRLE